MEIVCEHGDFERGKEEQEGEQLRDARENEKFLKPFQKDPYCAKHTIFAAGMSRE